MHSFDFDKLLWWWNVQKSMREVIFGGGGWHKGAFIEIGLRLDFSVWKIPLNPLWFTFHQRNWHKKKSWVLAKTKTGQITTQTVVFKPANDSLEKFIPRTKLLGEKKFEIPDDQEENYNESNLAFTYKVLSSQWTHYSLTEATRIYSHWYLKIKD